MNRRTQVLAAPLLAAVALLAGCGGSGSSKASASGSASSSSAALPTVAGSYGTKPALTFPASAPPTTLQVKTLRQGTGPVVAKGDLLVADYLGQVWKGKVFDNSYDRKVASGFPIGTGKVIPGWDTALVGVKAGSRVLMSVPPAQGYGTTGNTSAGITGTDTLVFVVDVVASYNPKLGSDPKGVLQRVSFPGIGIRGELGAVPSLKVATNAPKPKAATSIVISKGTGKPVTKGGLLVVQYVATDYADKTAGSTWADGAPVAVPVGTATASGQASPFDKLLGLPVGSRVLLELPAQTGQAAVAVLVDVVGETTTAAQHG